MSVATPPPSAVPSSAPASEPMPPSLPAARPTRVTAAALTLIVIGVLAVLLGALLFVFFGAFAGGVGSGADFGADFGVPGFDRFGPGTVGMIIGVTLALAGIIVVYGLLGVVAGINILSGRNWARVVGIILAALGGLLSLAALAPDAAGQASSPIVTIVLIAAYAFVVFALATSARWFAAHRS